jgi:hypothetical protein
MNIMSETIYSLDQVVRIQRSYSSVFSNVTPELTAYWDLERQRPWSCLTTDFRIATFQKLWALHERVLKIDAELTLAPHTKEETLRQAAAEEGAGFSIGLSPWTDNLLCHTYSDEKDQVTILLGHDWYPIVTNNSRSGSPLRSDDTLHHVPRYWPAVPEAVLTGETVGLFFNLYPDYRPPGNPKCGSLARYSYSYAECLLGLDAMVEVISRRFNHVRLISWGANVWAVLLPRVKGVAPKTGLSVQIAEASGNVMEIELGGRRLEYLPLMHPGHWGNFGRRLHLQHVKRGFSDLGLGLPGMAESQNRKVDIARQISPA